MTKTKIPQPTQPDILRRRFLQALPVALLSPQVLAQGSDNTIAVRKLHSFGLRVSDLERSVAFYQDLFGAPIQARSGDTVCLRIGSGPHFFSLTPTRGTETPGYTHVGLSVADFNLTEVQNQLADWGITPIDYSDRLSRLDLAMHSWVQTRGETRELYFADIEGLVYQLVPQNHCGGGGALGTVCENVEVSTTAGMFELVDLSHFTNFMANGSRANNFYRSVFGLNYQAYQGPTSPIVGVGDGIQFMMYIGGVQEGTPDNAALVHHTCFSVNDFFVDDIRGQLTDYGLTATDDGNASLPLTHWVSMRMPNRGGAQGGTPELYFADPDGIRIQLQDPDYCGGGGYLGDACPPLPENA